MGEQLPDGDGVAGDVAEEGDVLVDGVVEGDRAALDQLEEGDGFVTEPTSYRVSAVAGALDATSRAPMPPADRRPSPSKTAVLAPGTSARHS